MPRKIDDKTLALLNRLLGDSRQLVPAVETRDKSREEIARVDLPLTLGADYFFRLWFYEDGERQISAHLILPRSEGAYFWHRTFEMSEFRGSEHSLVNQFCKELEVLLTHETRIVQRKGWLSWHFDCQYREGKEWKNLGGHSAFRGGGFEPPYNEGRRRVYHAAPDRQRSRC